VKKSIERDDDGSRDVTRSLSSSVDASEMWLAAYDGHGRGVGRAASEKTIVRGILLLCSVYRCRDMSGSCFTVWLYARVLVAFR